MLLLGLLIYLRCRQQRAVSLFAQPGITGGEGHRLEKGYGSVGALYVPTSYRTLFACNGLARSGALAAVNESFTQYLPKTGTS